MIQDNKDKDKAKCVFERLFSSKTPKGISEYIKNWRIKAEQEKKMEEAEQIHNSPDFIQDWIQSRSK